MGLPIFPAIILPVEYFILLIYYNCKHIGFSLRNPKIFINAGWKSVSFLKSLTDSRHSDKGNNHHQYNQVLQSEHSIYELQIQKQNIANIPKVHQNVFKVTMRVTSVYACFSTLSIITVLRFLNIMFVKYTHSIAVVPLLYHYGMPLYKHVKIELFIL